MPHLVVGLVSNTLAGSTMVRVADGTGPRRLGMAMGILPVSPPWLWMSGVPRSTTGGENGDGMNVKQPTSP